MQYGRAQHTLGFTNMYELALVANIIIGIINFNNASAQYKQGAWTRGDVSFFCGILNTMPGVGMIGYYVYRVLVS